MDKKTRRDSGGGGCEGSGCGRQWALRQGYECRRGLVPGYTHFEKHHEAMEMTEPVVAGR